MPKNVVFVGKRIADLSEKLGYLNSLIDQGAIGHYIIPFEGWSPEDLDLFKEVRIDEKLKGVLSEMPLPKGYLILKTQVLDEPKLNELVPKFCKRYGMQFKIY